MNASARALLFVCVMLPALGLTQGLRDRVRLDRSGEALSPVEARAAEITLTVAPLSQQLLQTWIRAAGVLDDSQRILRGCVAAETGALLEVGQRVRAFAPDSKSRVSQARVTSVEAGPACVAVEATLAGPTGSAATRYVMEIIVDRGMRLAVANAAIIERDGRQIVYEQIHPGHYEPHEIRTGLKGETYTEVLDGIAEGYQIITIGSFFIDAEYRMKTAPEAGMDAHHHH